MQRSRSLHAQPHGVVGSTALALLAGAILLACGSGGGASDDAPTHRDSVRKPVYRFARAPIVIFTRRQGSQQYTVFARTNRPLPHRGHIRADIAVEGSASDLPGLLRFGTRPTCYEQNRAVARREPFDGERRRVILRVAGRTEHVLASVRINVVTSSQYTNNPKRNRFPQALGCPTKTTRTRTVRGPEDRPVGRLEFATTPLVRFAEFRPAGSYGFSIVFKMRRLLPETSRDDVRSERTC